MASDGRLIVGIDLGTTHTVVAWAEASSGAMPQVLPIPQMVSPSEVASPTLLDSVLYAPVAGELAADPWGEAPWLVGQAARRRGAEVPGRLVSSAKSWLCHGAVDRLAPILPWGVNEREADFPRISPVDVSAALLRHVRSVWDLQFPTAPLAEQRVVLTVPASFDEAARELTLEATRRAGLTARLLEEPQAAFYDFMSQAGPLGMQALVRKCPDGAMILVCDIGGGTTDLSLIRLGVAGKESGLPEVTRVAVGQHLLLGGDNMDLALAHACEGQIVQPPGRLDAARFAQLVLACRAAKEQLLAGSGAPDRVSVAVAGQGARLVGGTVSAEVSREEAERLVLDGFFPLVSRNERPHRLRTALVGFGLPYEQDPAISRHVGWFFARHAPERLGPDFLLLNGGVFRADRIARRLAEVIDRWGGRKVELLPHTDPDVAVARGAVVFGLALAGFGPRIEAGAARGYYVGLGKPNAEAVAQAVCLVPRGAKEGSVHTAAGRSFGLVVGRPVRFDLYASDDVDHSAGDVVEIDDEHFQPLPPVATVLGSGEVGRGREREIRVRLEGELTAVGTLEMACVETQEEKGIGRRYQLAFQLREQREGGSAAEAGPPKMESAGGKRIEQVRETIDRVFGKARSDVAVREVKDLLRDLERVLGERSSWTLQTTRSIFDILWALHGARRRSLDHERAFWLLAGYCLRPGFGDAGDPARVQGLFRLFDQALAFPAEARGWRHFWITWRRVAAGLGDNDQEHIRECVDPLLSPDNRTGRKAKRFRAESPDELLELAACLERIAPQRRALLGGWVLERTWTDRDPRLRLALGKIGARVPTYASVHQVVAPHAVEQWLDHLMREKWDVLPSAPQAAVQMARVTGDRVRDVSDSLRREVQKRLIACQAPSEWIRAVREFVPVEESDRTAFYGEGLPVGLRLVG